MGGPFDTISRVKRFLPVGTSLPDEIWKRRHLALVTILWLHAVGVFIFGVLRGFGVGHMFLEASLLAACAAVGSIRAIRNKVRMIAVSFGLLSSSAILVHLAGGLIEMHFHFFVMVAAVTLYQSWMPFLLAVGYVVVHHGVMGAIDPAAVFNHPAAVANPWRWAALHGLFILGECAACLAAWRMNEIEGKRANSYHTRLAALVESSHDAIFGLAPTGEILSCNPAAERLFGYPTEEMIGKSGDMLADPEARDVSRRAMQLVRAGRQVERYDVRGAKKDGSVIETTVTLSPVLNDGEFVGASAIVRDATREKTAERQMRESLSLLNATLDSTADGLLVVDLDGKIVNFNHRFLEMWGIEPQAVSVGEDQIALVHLLDQLVDPQACLVKVAETFAEPDTPSYDLLELKDGRFFERYSQPQKVGSEIVGRVWSLRDVSDSARSQERLELALEREKQASTRLRELDEIKNSFLEAVSHELRTPLTSVLGYALTLESHGERLTVEQRSNMVKDLGRNARKLDRLLSDLLDLDRLVKGILEPEMSSADVKELVEAAVQDVAHPSHQLTIEVEEVRAELDGPRVQRILENLVANAVKYTPAGSHIWVRVKTDGNGLQIAVEDDGPGIPPHLVDRVFDPFERGDQNRHSPGTGIGLALVSRFAELHGGEAWVEDRPGGGASFRVTLRCPVTSRVSVA